MKNRRIITDSREGKINSYMGEVIDFINPTAEMIFAQDIAQGLGNICRFGGQIEKFYSVAQHSVLVSLLSPPHFKVAALLHDAPEAYLGDVITPLKHLISQQYLPLEKKMTQAIFDCFGVSIKLLDAIKFYDMIAYQMERKFLKEGDSRDWVKFWETHGYGVMLWPPAFASKEYMIHLLRNEKEVANGN